MYFQIRRLCYGQMKEICENRQTLGYRIKHSIEIILFIFWLIRMSLAILSYCSHKFNYWLYDPCVILFYDQNPKLFVHYTFIVAIIVLTAMMETYVIFLYRLDPIVRQYFYDMVVVNTEQISQCYHSPEEIKQTLENMYQTNMKQFDYKNIFCSTSSLYYIQRVYCWIKTRIQFILLLGHLDLKKASSYKLKSLPYLSIKSRSMLELGLSCMDKFFYYLHFVLILFFIPAMIFYYYITWNMFPFTEWQN
uniref:Uncharacterized protein LOC113790214 n=1 Tax=Dermatophagoides pteronyssinus TaxID=6956 RepID=A0A6P6XQG4_DERPT|nr:uncharacterized protein LOC113790214 [Dermatophagoides pteronyssinus]